MRSQYAPQKSTGDGTEVMAQQLRKNISLTENQSSVPSTQGWQLTTAYTFISRGSGIFWPLEVPFCVWHTLTQYTDTEIKPQQLGASQYVLNGIQAGKASIACTFSGHSGRQNTMIRCAICTASLKTTA